MTKLRISTTKTAQIHLILITQMKQIEYNKRNLIKSLKSRREIRKSDKQSMHRNYNTKFTLMYFKN